VKCQPFQHVEIARDIAIKFNNRFGDVLKIPSFQIQETGSLVPGLDGQKMSKSYKNTIPIFMNEKARAKVINKIKTDNSAVHEPKEFNNCNVYNIAKLFLSNEERLDFESRYVAGRKGHGHFKKYLSEQMHSYFKEFSDKRSYYENHEHEVRKILTRGAEKS